MKSVRDTIQQGDKYFRWRGAETSRLEALFDVVLAMALTLTVISLEIPQTFDDLMASFAKLPSFAVCFVILLTCWIYLLIGPLQVANGLYWGLKIREPKTTA